ncbi:LacI family transcriptional regulator [Scopulibacillus daqui]|uniref:LacI family transcriptional regulator n=1 Tax=Scopulibacillus daqui TaxID=1469162 RepID=A0ABS2Q2V6_9BACL|nr:LacI family DNA-binding transcriptional regulator [Scopulibacillus daqui]MBM7646633.1 LacI family transcriptional regulator [Scopulibacillus daqui]
MKPTIYDVAEKAGVSIATVSKVINNTGKISDKTKQKVLKIMEEINYQPSVVASALTGKQTNTIGFLIPDIANPFHAEMARSVEDRGHELGFSVVMCNTDGNLDKEAQYLEWLQRKRVDGIILGSAAQNNAIIKELIKQEIPAALIATDMPSLSVNAVLVDDFLGGYQAISHLTSLGHTDIAFLAGNLNNVMEKERLRGYKQALQEAGAAFDRKNLLTNNFSFDDAKRSMKKLIESGRRPTAVFAFNDLLAIGAIHGAKEAGLKIPDDLSVIGFDNTLLAAVNDPPLTTIAQPIQDMGRTVTDLLVKEIKGGNTVKQRVVLLPELVVRQTTIPPKI